MPKPPRDESKFTDEHKSMRATLAKRLKECREVKGVTLEQAAEDLGISRQALTAYEVLSEHHTSFKKGFGMNITFLWNIANYYDVSTDFLLGRHNVKRGNADVVAVEKRLGLTEMMQGCLAFYMQLETDTGDAFRYILESETFHELVHAITGAANRKRVYPLMEDDAIIDKHGEPVYSIFGLRAYDVGLIDQLKVQELARELLNEYLEEI